MPQYPQDYIAPDNVDNGDGTISKRVQLTGSNGIKAVVGSDGSLQVNIAGSSATGGALGVDITTAEAIVPIDVQSHLQSTIQTHNAVSVGATTWSSDTSWRDSDGFDKIAVSMLNDAMTTCQAQVLWSNDGTSQHGVDNVIPSTSNKFSDGIIDTKARYFKITIYNGDTVAHTMSAWAYLKA